MSVHLVGVLVRAWTKDVAALTQCQLPAADRRAACQRGWVEPRRRAAPSGSRDLAAVRRAGPRPGGRRLDEGRLPEGAATVLRRDGQSHDRGASMKDGS